MRRTVGQLGFADALATPQAKAAERLFRIDGLIDWRALAAELDHLCRARTGRPGWPPLVLFKALLLTRW